MNIKVTYTVRLLYLIQIVSLYKAQTYENKSEYYIRKIFLIKGMVFGFITFPRQNKNCLRYFLHIVVFKIVRMVPFQLFT